MQNNDIPDMEKEIAITEMLLMNNQKKIDEFRKGEDKEALDFAETTDKALIKIAKLVRAEARRLKMNGKGNISSIAEKLLDESATAYIKGDADSAEIRIVDNIHLNTLARLKVRISQPTGALMIDEIRFGDS